MLISLKKKDYLIPLYLQSRNIQEGETRLVFYQRISYGELVKQLLDGVAKGNTQKKTRDSNSRNQVSLLGRQREETGIARIQGLGSGTPLQYSCLENPMDGGAWQAAVHGVVKSRTQLSNFTFTFHFHALEKEMQPTPVFLPGESQGRRSLVGGRLWGCTESDTTEVTQQGVQGHG